MNKDVLIRLNGISKAYDGETVLDNLSLEIHDKEFMTLLGPSGCGKTTTLRMIGGFETPDTGDVFFDGKRINDVPPYERQVNTVFQRYAREPYSQVYNRLCSDLRGHLQNIQKYGYQRKSQRCEYDTHHCRCYEHSIYGIPYLFVILCTEITRNYNSCSA